ncbi:hypothetical protein NQ314_019652, partial [Rhamnusium bicolor]
MMTFDLKNMSIAHWFCDKEKHRCGYCKNDNGSLSNGMWTETLTVEDYQALIDRGWRRSGKYCYKPVMHQTCCPQYTIKCDSLNFSLSKSQKKVIKKFNKYLENGILSKKDIPLEAQCSEGYDNSSVFVKECPNINFSEFSNKPIEMHIWLRVNLVHKKKFNLKSGFREGVGADSSKPPCKKAKLLRLERKKEKLLKKGENFERATPVGQVEKTIEQFLDEFPQNSKHKLRITLERMSKSHELFKTSSKLFRTYQTKIHSEAVDECDEEQFFNFLVQSPLKPVKFPHGVDGPGYGSFHQQYWINDKLVAVGVIDILPRCVSSVYFFYDPDYRNLTLGTYGSLRRVQFTRSLHEKVPEISNYYMGFYIHSCQKMRYKGKLVPSFLLCPETYHWIPIEKCIAKLDVNKYARLAHMDELDQNEPNQSDIDQIKVIYDYKLMRFRDYKSCSNKKTKKCCDKQYYEEEKPLEIIDDQDMVNDCLIEKSVIWENKLLKEMNTNLRENVKQLKEKIGNLETENFELKEIVNKEKKQTKSHEKLINIITETLKEKFDCNFEMLGKKINILDLKIESLSMYKTEKDKSIKEQKTLSTEKQQTLPRYNSSGISKQLDTGTPKQLNTETTKQLILTKASTSNQNNLVILEDHQKHIMNEIINLETNERSQGESMTQKQQNNDNWQIVQRKKEETLVKQKTMKNLKEQNQ